MRKGKLYVAMGDSVTWTVATTEVYPTIITRNINKDYSPIQIANKGRGGSRTDQWVKEGYFNRVVCSLPFDLLTIGLGMNDCSNQLVSVSDYGNNLRKMVDLAKIQRPNATIVLCAPNATSDANRTPYIQNYRNEMQAVATEKGVHFCDFSQAFTDTVTYTTDGVHPNDAGHQLIATLLYQVIKQTNFVDSFSN